LNLRDLDRFRQIGRYAQLVGALLVVAPTLSAIMRTVTGPTGPNTLLDPLVAFNPTGFAYRHPLWVAAGSAPLGIATLVIGTRFLSRQPSARLAMNRLCWLGVWLCLAQAALFGLSIPFMLGFPIIVGFAVVAVLMCGFFALILYRVIGDLTNPEILAEFGGQHAS